jgi:phage shock protein PspC (stress-responsive transcriptional regulator)
MPDEGKLGGVCAGIAAYLDLDVTIVRLAWIILSIVPGVLLGGVLAYIAAWVLMPEATPAERAGAPAGRRRLMRSSTDSMLGGVCGGLAEFLGVDATLVRVVTVVLAIYPGAVIGGVLVYLVAWFVVPPRPASIAAAPHETGSAPA